MKKIFTLTAALFFGAASLLPTITKAQSCPWAKRAGGNNDDFSTAVATDASGNVYQLGNFYSQTIAVTGTNTLTVNLSNQPYQAFNYGSEMYLAKYDSCGALKWAKKAGGKNGDTYGTSVATDATGNIYVTGFFQTDTVYFGTNFLVSNGYRDVFVAKYDANGVVQWVRQGSGNNHDMAFAITVDALNDVYIAGRFQSTYVKFGVDSFANGTNDNYTYDAFIAKFDNSGNIQWVTGSVSHSSSNGYVYPYGISSDASGNVYVGGRFDSDYIRFNNDSLATNGYNDVFLVKYDANGNEVWLRTAGGTDDESINGVASDASGNVTVTGYIGAGTTVNFGTHSISNAAVNRNIFIAKYDANGTDLWAKTVGCDHWSDNLATAISLDPQGNAYITGTYSSDSLNVGPVTLFNTSYNNGNGGDYFYDIFVAKYKPNGSLVWARSAGGDSTDIGYGIASGPHGALYLSGAFRSPSIAFAGINLNIANSSVYGSNDAFISNNIATLPITPDICLVSADTMWNGNQYNVVYWDKTPYTTVSNFVVYREVTSGVYKKIGSQPYSALSMFIDTARSIGPSNGNPFIGTYRYKIRLMDTSGTYSFMSPYHNTVYFQNNSGTFNWNLYTVENMTITPVSTFDLVRDDNATGAWHVISSIAGTQTSQADPNYTTFQATADWRVEAQGFNCTPTFRLGHNSTQAAIIKSKSNISNNRGIGVAQLSNLSSQISVYPNPAKGIFVIETNLTEKQNVQVVDVNGKVVLSTVITGTTNVDASNLSEGVYTINIVNNTNIANKRLVIVK